MSGIDAQSIALRYPMKSAASLSNLGGASGRRADTVGGQVTRKRGGRVEVEALSDITFSLGNGDRLGLIGDNGAGKTTLLKVLHGILRPSAGRLAIHGSTDALFNINLGFRPHATGRRNIVLRGLINGWHRKDIEARIDEIVEFSQLGEFIDTPFRYYSQGMAARLAFAAATAFEPEILLMDEWIGAGDPSFHAKAQARIKSVVESASIIVIASHNSAILRKTCTHGLILDHGKSTFFGPIEDALGRYAAGGRKQSASDE